MTYVLVTLLFLAVVGGAIWIRTRGLRSTPPQLKPGEPLSDFRAVDEQGGPVRSVEPGIDHQG